MQSKIRIEFDFETKEPILEIALDKNSSDLRDKMLHNFAQKASCGGSRLYMTYRYINNDTASIVQIRCSEPDNSEEEQLSM